MKRSESNGKLEAFFEQNPPDDDLVYLKNYVKEHPDNKMGWYLLGREYAAREKHGKAQYCFAQAGEVYEAFEKRVINPEVPGVQAGRLPALQARTEGGRRQWPSRAARIAAAFLMVLLLGSLLPAGEDKPEDKQRKEAPVSAAAPVPAAAAPSGLQVYYTHPLEASSQADAVWKRMVQPGGGAEALPASVYLFRGRPTTDNKWIDWLRTPSLVASGERSPDGGEMVLRYREAGSCNCSPEPDRKAEEAVRMWMGRQEELVILQSAIRSYIALYGGDLPADIEGLTRDFPHNLLPGYTPYMKESYPEMAASAKAVASSEGTADPTVSTSTKAKLSEALPTPLEIVVDKETHRLALVSGSVILRSYPVGLGGSRTPEGTFRITDKVRNPNGREDGDFGSRGMQLSDTAYAIHGTNQPKSIGEDRSLGCVRMLKEDIEELFDMVPAGTKVTIGQGLLPDDTIRRDDPFRMPRLREESNPEKIYRWL